MSRWFYHPFTVITFTIVVTWLYASLLRTEGKMRMSTESVTVLDQEVTQIASEVSALELQLNQAKSAAAQEQRIRDELLLQKPGEYVIQLPLLQEQQPAPASTRKASAWEEWQQLLGIAQP